MINHTHHTRPLKNTLLAIVILGLAPRTFVLELAIAIVILGLVPRTFALELAVKALGTGPRVT